VDVGGLINLCLRGFFSGGLGIKISLNFIYSFIFLTNDTPHF
jgi:hypothetical protein